MLRRLLELDRAIRDREFPNARRLAQHLEVSERTILRDLAFMRESWHAPLEYCAKRQGFFYSRPDYQLPSIRLTEGELLALFLAERLMQQYRGAPFARDLALTFEKFTASLPENVSLHLDHLQEAYSFRTKPVSADNVKIFGQLVQAVQDHKRVDLEYWTASRNVTNRRKVDPYHLTLIEGGWYLIGYCHLREEELMFATGRIRSLRITPEKFERPASFQLSRYLDKSFRVMRGEQSYQVRLLFTAAVAPYIREREWQPDQKLRSRRDGRLEMTLRVSHLLEVRRWVMSWGSDCEVLEPAELQTEIQHELEQMIRLRDQ
jgi:predicted DNA-binding transcriptional regulator YafY